jgi:uncharacterized membrane protein
MWMMLAGVAGLALLFWLALRPKNRYRRMPDRPYDRTMPPPPEPRQDDAMEVLRGRLASGEITPEEFDSIKAKLLEDRHP